MVIIKLQSLIISIFLSLISLSFCTYGSPPANSPTTLQPPTTIIQSPEAGASGNLTIQFDYTKQSGSASNQFAVWIEDANHNYVKTLYATRYTANGGYKNRPDSLREWVAKSGLADMKNTEVDAISGATPAAGTLTYTWDLTGADGAPVPSGLYIFIVEGTLRWKNQVIYTGAIEAGGIAADITPEPIYAYEGSGNQPALSSDSIENNMISNVSAHYEPS